MSRLVILVLLSSLVVFAHARKCKPNCHMNSKLIVCGSDGITYRNQCVMKTWACIKGKTVSVASHGWCGDSSEESKEGGVGGGDSSEEENYRPRPRPRPQPPHQPTVKPMKPTTEVAPDIDVATVDPAVDRPTTIDPAVDRITTFDPVVDLTTTIDPVVEGNFTTVISTDETVAATIQSNASATITTRTPLGWETNKPASATTDILEGFEPMTSGSITDSSDILTTTGRIATNDATQATRTPTLHTKLYPQSTTTLPLKTTSISAQTTRKLPTESSQQTTESIVALETTTELVGDKEEGSTVELFSSSVFPGFDSVVTMVTSDEPTSDPEVAITTATEGSTAKMVPVVDVDGGNTKCTQSCPLILDIVCGTDGVSYQSRCVLEVEACMTGDLTLKPQHLGECEPGCDGTRAQEIPKDAEPLRILA